MSDDDFLARWSRRKRAARTGEAQMPDAEPQAAASPTCPQPSAATPAANKPPEPLPSLEDLTADSDLVAFLREGVPAALRSAAMRKMWSLDPVIRDYVGPSEYAWDFNQPGSMAGFGALGPNTSVAGFLSTVSRVLPAEDPPTPPLQGTAAVEQTASVAPAEPATPPEPPRAADQVELAPEPPAEADRGEQAPPRPRHGGALPR
jgi:hypothetical protein